MAGELDKLVEAWMKKNMRNKDPEICEARNLLRAATLQLYQTKMLAREILNPLPPSLGEEPVRMVGVMMSPDTLGKVKRLANVKS